MKGRGKIVASIEARMGSERLPGKVLKDICGAPALTRLLNRLRFSKCLDDIVLATTIHSKDDLLEEWARKEGVKFYRGSEEDVLERVVRAHQMMETDIIVEITGDMILLDPGLIDQGIEDFLEKDVDVVTNVAKPCFPQGIDVQVFRLKDLEEVERRVKEGDVREHVSCYFYRNPEKYRIFHIDAPASWKRPDYRFQLDYPEDLEFIQSVYQILLPEYGEKFGMREIVELLQQRPELLKKFFRQRA